MTGASWKTDKSKKGNLVSLSTETRNLERRVAVEATKNDVGGAVAVRLKCMYIL